MKTTTHIRPTQPGRPRWPEARGRAPEPPAPAFRPEFAADTPAHDFLVINPRPDLIAPPPPPHDLTFYNIDFP